MDNLREVAEILGETGQAQSRLIVVGGSYLALHGLRKATGTSTPLRFWTRPSARQFTRWPGTGGWRHIG